MTIHLTMAGTAKLLGLNPALYIDPLLNRLSRQRSYYQKRHLALGSDDHLGWDALCRLIRTERAYNKRYNETDRGRA